jgi:2-dehydro-3-deoxy-D-arabinonate dehydratase
LKLYRTTQGAYVEEQGRFHMLTPLSLLEEWDRLICDPQLHARAHAATRISPIQAFDRASILAPIASQEVWAAGVTYHRSRKARMEESKSNGGGDLYDHVYSAERPELFFKATGQRVVGPGRLVNIRSDAKWSVPEPELTLLINPQGTIIGCTIGNDMSSRDIEGENPLYLPQAKVYAGSCALGPCILLCAEPPPGTTITLEIRRQERSVFSGSTTLAELKRELKELVHFLFRDNCFPAGVFLMTGTGIVPDDGFTLAHGDLIRIAIEGIGTLENNVA